jgi:hypothetical protein
MPKNVSKKSTYWIGVAINWVGRQVKPTPPTNRPCKRRDLPMKRQWGGK